MLPAASKRKGGIESSLIQGDFTAPAPISADFTCIHESFDAWSLNCLEDCLKVVSSTETTKGKIMLWTIFVILLVLWLLGMVSSYTMGGFIHILLVVAIAVLLINVITGRRAV